MNHDEYYRHKNNVVAKAFYENREALLMQNRSFQEHKVFMTEGDDTWRCKRCLDTWKLADFPDAPYFLWQQCRSPSELIQGLTKSAPVNSMTEKLKRGHKLFTKGKLYQPDEIGQAARIHLADGFYTGKESYDKVDFSADPEGIWVYNKTTQKYYCLSYREIYDLAKDAGISAASSYTFTQNK